MKLDELVGKYIQLRDKKAAIKKEYDERIGKIDQILDGVESLLLKTFEELGTESVKTEAGTAYKSVRTSATVADWDAFWDYVNANEAFELLERRCNKTAVEQHKAANGQLPPGLNWREERVVNIRRS